MRDDLPGVIHQPSHPGLVVLHRDAGRRVDQPGAEQAVKKKSGPLVVQDELVPDHHLALRVREGVSFEAHLGLPTSSGFEVEEPVELAELGEVDINRELLGVTWVAVLLAASSNPCCRQPETSGTCASSGP